MEDISIIVHVLNFYVKKGITEYLKEHFPQIRIVDSPDSYKHLYAAIKLTKANIIITDMLCKPPIPPDRHIFDIVEACSNDRKLILWEAAPYAAHFYPFLLHPTNYRLDQGITLKKMHKLFENIITNEKITDFELRKAISTKRLSNREVMVISGLIGDKTTKEISYELDIDMKTVSRYKRNALRKLRIKSLGSLFLYK